MKIDIDSTYQGRLEELDKQIKSETRKKHWGLKKVLENEKKRILKCMSNKEE